MNRLNALRTVFLLTSLVACTNISEEATSAPALGTQGSVPSGFEDALVTSVASPTALAWTPDGRLLITSQQGKLWVHKDGVTLPTPALDLGMRLCANRERGLLGVAVDPGFASNGYLYLFYTYNKLNSCSTDNSSSNPVHRVSRFTMTGDTVSTGSERVYLTIPSPIGGHTSGDVQIGKDGLLYVSVGDGYCDYARNSGCAAENDAARDPHTLLGKILRITRDGAIPSSNPYRGTNSARCNLTGRTSAGTYCQETYASGLRNPFRMAFDPNSSSTRFFINDVGQDAWEEVDLGKSGADYGWNRREGPCVVNTTSGCTPESGRTDPEFSYKHSPTGTFAECASITGGAFTPNGLWPSLDGSYLFGDYVCGKIFRIAKSGTSYTVSVFASRLGNSSAVHMAFGPYKSSKALYYTSYANGGEVRRISYTGSSNQPPVAVASASPTSGALPLEVDFSASGSRDPEGVPLVYSWAFGDGKTATGAEVSHTYATKGVYSVVLMVTDVQGASGKTTVRVDAGNTPPTPTLTSPSTSTRFGVGETVTLKGRAVDNEDGTLPTSRLSWRVLLHHDAHTHPYAEGTGSELRITMPQPENLAATKTSYLDVFLTATDTSGLSKTVSGRVNPALVSLTFKTSPTGLKLKIGGQTFTTPKTVSSWKGYKLNLSAPTQTTSVGKTATFRSWSDGGAASRTVTTPAASNTYTATFAIK